MRRDGLHRLALVAVVALVGASCGGGGGGGGGGGAGGGEFSGVTITFSTSVAQSEVAGVRQVLDMFQDETGAKVNLTQVTAQDLPQKLKVDVGAGKPTIHLFGQDNLALAVLVEDGLVEDLSDVQIPDGVTPALTPQKFDGKQYFLPFKPDVRVAYANNTRFQEANVQPPRTVEEYISVAEKLKATAGQPKVTLSLASQPDTGPLGVTISEWIVSYGGDPLILNDQGSVAAFTTLQQLWQDELVAKESLQAKYDTEVDNLTGETAWYAQNWPFTSAELSDQGLLTEFTVYEGWAGPARAAHVIGGQVLGVPKGVTGQQKDAAVALAEFIMSKEAQEVLVVENAWASVRADALGKVPEEQKTTYDAIQAALSDGWYRPNVVYWSDVEAAMNAAIQRIMIKGEPVQATLDELHGEIESAAQTKGAEYPPSE
ncbi:MAG: ABC transporter substrate-binding protein [Actinomycetota bacterium]